jgi:hypothetical protein
MHRSFSQELYQKLLPFSPMPYKDPETKKEYDRELQKKRYQQSKQKKKEKKQNHNESQRRHIAKKNMEKKNIDSNKTSMNRDTSSDSAIASGNNNAPEHRLVVDDQSAEMTLQPRRSSSVWEELGREDVLLTDDDMNRLSRNINTMVMANDRSRSDIIEMARENSQAMAFLARATLASAKKKQRLIANQASLESPSCYPTAETIDLPPREDPIYSPAASACATPQAEPSPNGGPSHGYRFKTEGAPKGSNVTIKPSANDEAESSFTRKGANTAAMGIFAGVHVEFPPAKFPATTTGRSNALPNFGNNGCAPTEIRGTPCGFTFGTAHPSTVAPPPAPPAFTFGACTPSNASNSARPFIFGALTSSSICSTRPKVPGFEFNLVPSSQSASQASALSTNKRRRRDENFEDAAI